MGGEEEHDAVNADDADHLVEDSRAKLYVLCQESGAWIDKGTGSLTWGISPTFDGPALSLRTEDNEVLLERRIEDKVEVSYNQGGKTIITWRDTESGEEIALSCASPTVCDNLWEFMKNAQEFQEGHESDAGLASMQDEPMIEIPDIEMGNLATLAQTVMCPEGPKEKKEAIADALLTRNALPRVLELHKMCKDLEADENLRHLYFIVTGMILLNSAPLLEQLFSDEYFIDVIDVLHVDPDYPSTSIDHKKFLTEQAEFREIVPIKDEDVVRKIHQNFRLLYLKDVILPRTLDDQSLFTINTLIYWNNMDIVRSLASNEAYLTELISRLRSKTTPEDKREDLLKLTVELCSLAKSLPPDGVREFYQNLEPLGFLDMIDENLDADSLIVRRRVCELLSCTVDFDPSYLREFAIRQPTQLSLFRKMIQLLWYDVDGGIQPSVAEILKVLLDPDTMVVANPSNEKDTRMESSHEKQQKAAARNAKKDTFFQAFYNATDCMLLLTKPLLEPGVLTSADVRNLDAVMHVCDLLSLCVAQHTYYIKYFFLRNTNVLSAIAGLAGHQHRFVGLAAIRFLQACLETKEDFYVKQIVQRSLFLPLIKCLKENGAIKNGPRYNLMNSAIMGLLEFVRKEGLTGVIEYLMRSHGEDLLAFEFLDTVKGLRDRYDQRNQEALTERPHSPGQPAPGVSEWRRAFVVDEDEAYFDRFDEQPESPTHLAAGGAHGMPLGTHTDSDSDSPNMDQCKSPPSPRRKRSLVDYDEEETVFSSMSQGKVHRPPALSTSPKRPVSISIVKKRRVGDNGVDPSSRPMSPPTMLAGLHRPVRPMGGGAKGHGTGTPAVEGGAAGGAGAVEAGAGAVEAGAGGTDEAGGDGVAAGTDGSAGAGSTGGAGDGGGEARRGGAGAGAGAGASVEASWL